tara:strand:+ start:252 stop:599 length:348 start_codon:yes stop_codon:yes gene_type:complete
MKKQEFDKMMKESFGDRVENISSNPTRTVTISTRVIYHKYAEVKIDIPNYIKSEDTINWLNDNDFLFDEDIEHKLWAAKYVFGFGCDADMCEKDSIYETRYDVYCKNQHLEGGHL